MDVITRLAYSGYCRKYLATPSYQIEMNNLASSTANSSPSSSLLDRITNLINKIFSFLYPNIESTTIEPSPVYSLTPQKGEITVKSSSMKLSGYLDMGEFEGIITKAITWYSKDFPNGFYKIDDLNGALDQIFDALVKDGTDQISLSFSQITDIAKLLDPDDLIYTQSDKILEILRWGTKDVKNLNKPIVKNDNLVLTKNIIQYIIDRAKTKGINTDLSFGGAAAIGSDYVFPQSAEKSALDLVKFLDEYHIDSVDFDIENIQGFLTNSKADILTFFKTLKSALNKENKTVSFTLLGSISQGPSGSLKFIFDEFDSLADFVRLMLYDGGTQFYIDANNEDWGLNKWVKIVKDPKKLSIGFYDKIPYETPASSDPDYSSEKYSGFPANTTRAQAAAWIYKRVLSQMSISINDFNKPFFWTDNPQTIATNAFISELDKDLNS
jgi:hypothetical protein